MVESQSEEQMRVIIVKSVYFNTAVTVDINKAISGLNSLTLDFEEEDI
jgi:hypothetical protein